MTTTLDPAEIAKFARTASRWWDADGPFAPLHRLNPARLSFIRERVAARFGPPETPRTPFAGLDFLDLGCGGGLVSEPLARLGARLTAIDAESETLRIAAAHAQAQGLAIHFREAAAEELAAEGATFDIVCALEIIEHTADAPAFLRLAAELVRPGGLLILSTLNRTPQAYALGIVAAERVLRWLPPGTHDYARFLKPEEMAQPLREAGLAVDAPVGLSLDLRTGAFTLSEDTSINYLLAAQKPQ